MVQLSTCIWQRRGERRGQLRELSRKSCSSASLVWKAKTKNYSDWPTLIFLISLRSGGGQQWEKKTTSNMGKCNPPLVSEGIFHFYTHICTLNTEEPKPDKRFELPSTSFPDAFLVCVQLEAADIRGNSWDNFEYWWRSFLWYVGNSYNIQ